MSQSLPIYCIDHFAENDEGRDFDIKDLRELRAKFQFTNYAHRHDFYDILIVTKGGGTHTIDFTTYEVKPGSIFFLTPGQVHCWELSEDIEGYSIFFKAEFYLMDCNVQKLLSFPFFHSMTQKPLLTMDCEQDPGFARILQELQFENTQNLLGREDAIRSLLDLLLIRFARNYTSTYSKYPSQTHLIRQFEMLVEENFASNKRPGDYAQLMNISAKYLNKLIKNSLGKSPRKVIHDRIILEAKRLLIHSSLTVSQIAHELGFDDNAYFNRFFKAKAKLTPDQYRRGNIVQY